MKKIEYEWIDGILYWTRIFEFLNEIDAIMIPSLSERVYIPDYARKLAEQAATLFIVESGDDIASCSVYCNTPIAFISSIAVKKNFLNQGIGTSLIDETKRYVRERGCKSMQLEVYVQNGIAISFYTKNGFNFVTENGNFIRMEYMFGTKEQ